MRAWSGLLSCCFRLLCCSCVVATSDDASAARRFAAAAKNHLDHGDARAFHAATGTAVEALLAALVKRPQNCTAIASSEKFVPHPLNAKGLHALRALVARKLSTETTLADDAWAKRLARRGLATEEFPVASLARVEHGDGSHSLQLPGALLSRLRALFGPRASVNAKLGGPDGAWQTTGARPTYNQLWMHVDTFLPTYKVWVFANLSRDAGPFSYVEGSHANDERKLKWLFERTKHLVDAASMPRDAPVRYAPGPYDERTHGFEGSLRVLGFDPADDRSKALARFGYAPAKPVLATRRDAALLVIADTSGFHMRGRAAGDAKRTQLVPRITEACHHRGDCDGRSARCGVGCVPRDDPFWQRKVD